MTFPTTGTTIIRYFAAVVQERRSDNPPQNEEFLGRDVRSFPFQFAKTVFDTLTIMVPHGVSVTVLGAMNEETAISCMPRIENGKGKNYFEKPWYEPPSEKMIYIFSRDLASNLTSPPGSKQVGMNNRWFDPIIPTVSMIFNREMDEARRIADQQSIPSNSISAQFRFSILRTYEGERAVRIIFRFDGQCLGFADLTFETAPNNVASQKTVNIVMHHPQSASHPPQIRENHVLTPLPSGYFFELISPELSGKLELPSTLDGVDVEKLQRCDDFLWGSNKVYQYNQNEQDPASKQESAVAQSAPLSINQTSRPGCFVRRPYLTLLDPVEEVIEEDADS